MKVHCFRHVPFEGLGNIEGWLKSKKFKLSSTCFYAADPLPQLDEIDLLIIMGGPMGAYDDKNYPWLTMEKKFIEAAISAEKKVLGICLGAQLIASVLGAIVYPHIHKEIGYFPLKLTEEGMESKFFRGFPVEFPAFHWHGDTFTFPRGAARLAETVACRNQAFSYDDRVIALQFHLDLKRENVEQLIENCGGELTKEKYIQTPEQMLLSPDEFRLIQEHMYKLLDNFVS